MGRGQHQYLTAATRRGSAPQGSIFEQSGSMGGIEPELTEEQRARLQNALSSLSGEGNARTVPAALLSDVSSRRKFFLTDGAGR